MPYANAAPLYLSRGLWPIPAVNKSPVPPGCTGRAGTVTAAKVEAWVNDGFWGSQNIAIRADGWIGIDVDVYEDKHGDQELAALEAQLGQLPATISSTARGHASPSRQYLFRIPDPMADFITKPGSSIEIIQRSHRYTICWPSLHDSGQQYTWYGYDEQPLDSPPSIDDFEMLPAAWLEYLTALPVEEHDGFTGNVEAWLGILPEGAPNGRVNALLAEIPEADFGHDVMTKLVYRMVRLGAENQPGIRQALVALQGAWLRGPYNTPDFRRDFDTALQGAILKAGAPEEEPDISLEFGSPTTIPTIDALNLLPEFTSQNKDFLDLVKDMPEVDTAELRHERLVQIIAESYLADLADHQVLTVAAASAVGKIDFPEGGAELWALVKASRPQPVAAVIEAPIKPDKLTSGRIRRIEFLTPDERERLSGRDGQWWGGRYIEWAKSRVKAYNGPYHRMNLWTILSLIFSPLGVVPLGEDDMQLNLFQFVLGKTTTGKTAAMKLLKRVLKAYYGPGNSPNIGGDATVNALVEKLISRDGLSSWFNADEAHGLFREMQGAQWRAGLREKWTELYEGHVPMILRNTKVDVSGIEAVTYFVMHLMGTIDDMIDVLDAEFWTSGFLARFIWAIGDDVERTPETMKLNLRRGPLAGSLDELPAQWAAEFRSTVTRLSTGNGPLTMDMSEEAEARHNEFIMAMDKQIQGHRNSERLIPTSIRFQLNILKCAALVALSEGSPIIDIRHELIALDQAGEWWANILFMVNATDETLLSRDVNKLERQIAAQRGGQMRLEAVYTNSPRRSKRGTDELLDQLKAEGRIVRLAQADGGEIVQLRGSEAA